MPRTTESIVAAHQAATARKAQGLPLWNGTFTFMQTLEPLAKRLHEGDTSLTSKELLEAFHAAANEVRTKVPNSEELMCRSEHFGLERFVQELLSWTQESVEASPDILNEFNELLDDFYDWADANRWWIEP